MKKMMKKALSVILVVVIVLTAAPLSGFVGLELPDWLDFSIMSKAAEYTSGYYTYTLSDDNKATITKGSTLLSGDVVIPSELDGYSVVAIGYSAFSNCTSLTSITLPSSLTNIGSYAFSGCTGLTSVTIPKSVAEMGWNIFSDCTNLNTVVFEEGMTKIPNNALDDATYVEKVVIPSTITEIGSSAFYDCTGLTSITLPSGLTSISSYAFQNCTGLTSITLPSGLTELGYYAFSGCTGLTGSITIPKTLTDAYWGIFEGCTNLDTVIFEEGMTKIPDKMLQYARDVKNVVIPSTVTSIGSSAFYDCTGLTSVTLPSGLTSIGYNAFSGCDNLTIVTSKYSESTISLIENNIKLSFREEGSLTTNFIDRNESKYYIDIESINYIGKIPVKLSYKPMDSVTAKNVNATIWIPNGVELDEVSIRVNGEMCQNYQYNNQKLIIPISDSQCDIEFYVTPENTETFLSYAQISATVNGKTVKDTVDIVNEKIEGLTITTDKKTSDANITLSGIAPASATVSVYVDDALVGTTTASKAGSYMYHLVLDNTTDGRVYNVEVRCTENDIEYSSDCLVRYEENVPEIVGFDMYYNNHNDARLDLLNVSKKAYISFNPNYPFTFTIDFTDNDKVENVCVVSTRNNETRYLDAKYDAEKDLYVASGFFGEDNKSYVPGALNVSYNIKQEKALVTETPDIDTSNISDVMKKAEVTKTYDEKTKTENYSINMSAVFEEMNMDIANEYFDFSVSLFDEAADSNISDWLGMTESAFNLVGYFVEGVDGKRYIAAHDLSDPEYYTLILKDVSGTANKYVKLRMAYNNSEVFTVLDEIAPNVDLSADIFSTVYNLVEHEANHKTLREEIMMSTTIEDKGEALRKADELLEDQKNYEALMFMLPLVVSTIGITGPVGICFTGLLAMIGTMAPFFWNTRTAQVKGQSVSVRWIVDPSGYVYEGVESNRLEGVKTTAYWIEYDENDADFWSAPDASKAKLWDSTEYDQFNPLYTNGEGKYAWDVPQGWWQVKYEKEGYETTYSEWLPVPPPQTEVNIAMTSTKSPEVKWFNNYGEYSEIAFSQYVQVDTVNTSNIVIKDIDGNIKTVSVTALDAEKSPNGTLLATTFRIAHSSDLEKCNVNVSSNVKSYSGKNMSANYNATKEAIHVFTGIEVAETVCGIRDNIVEIPVQLTPYGDATGMEIICTTSQSNLVEIISVGTLDNTGKAVIKVKASLPGVYDIVINVKNTTVEKMIKFNAVLPDEYIPEDPECSHTTTEIVNCVAPTCTTVGYAGDVKCTECGEILESLGNVAATGHNYVPTITSPTCTTGGYTTYNCAACGDAYTADETSALGHTFENGACKVCGEKDPTVPEEPEYNYTFSIQSPSRTEIRNKDGIILHANVESNAPNGSYIRWESSNVNFSTSADGSNLKIIAKNKGYTTFTAILCDADGNELARDSVVMYSKSGFFDKIGGFFRSLFGTTKIYEN